MITKEQVADLQPGDVVELTLDGRPADQYRIRGRVVHHGNGEYSVGGEKVLRWGDGRLASWTEVWTLTVVSRAPRPLYVNSDRTEPARGDVVRSADPQNTNQWMFDGRWFHSMDGDGFSRDRLPARLRLLVDGTTGQAVTP